tara:strand:- start:45 stop:1316 length:1272 start_codon:yes stop_codon:yes gene_type:complete
MFSDTLRPHQLRAYKAMSKHNGKVIIPTGGGKTFVMIADCIRELATKTDQTIVVVAPRILLANQLCSEFFEQNLDGKHNLTIECLHVHSGETHFDSTLKTDHITRWVNNVMQAGENRIIFTTYHSLHRVVDSGILIDTIYFDEAHNGTAKNFFIPVERLSHRPRTRRYFFTATPKVSRGKKSANGVRGMCNVKVWGRTLEQTTAQELIEGGSILPPKVMPFETDRVRDRYNAHEVDADNLKDMIDSMNVINPKILVAGQSTANINAILTRTDTLAWLYMQGFDVLHITSKYGANINGTKVGREEFFNTLTEYGKDENKKFIIFHYSILSEGINVAGLTHTIMLRNLPTIEMAQTIGRVIRIHPKDRSAMAEGRIPVGAIELYHKPYGQVCVPLSGKYSQRIAKKIQDVVDYIFIEGIPPLSYV